MIPAGSPRNFSPLVAFQEVILADAVGTKVNAIAAASCKIMIVGVNLFMGKTGIIGLVGRQGGFRNRELQFLCSNL
jgi:hypothetical protein